jgi:predicted nucleic acid-binding protein
MWLLTEEILSEYVEVLQRLNVRAASTIITLIREEGLFVRRIKKLGDLPDPDDAPFCECAESGNPDFIVTLNPADFPLSRLKAKVIAPADPLPRRWRKPRPRRRRFMVRKK